MYVQGSICMWLSWFHLSSKLGLQEVIKSGVMEKRGGSEVGLEGLGAGYWWLQWFRSLLGKLLKVDTHNNYALVALDRLYSDNYFSLWLKCTGSEDFASQSGLSSSTHFWGIFFFLRRNLHRTHGKQKHASKRSDNIPKKKAVSHQSKWVCHFLICTKLGQHIHWKQKTQVSWKC